MATLHHKDDHLQIYQMIDSLSQAVQRVDDRTRSVERIVSNGLRERTMRIETKLDATDEKLGAIVREFHEMNRRIDGCVDTERYETDRREQWDGQERRREAAKMTASDRGFRIALIIFQVLTATAVAAVATKVLG